MHSLLRGRSEGDLANVPQHGSCFVSVVSSNSDWILSNALEAPLDLREKELGFEG